VSLGAFYPSLIGPLLFCAVSIAASRILLGMHFLSDVVVGAILGSGLALTSYSVFS
jgi:undecaprenyl-diphosphatase